MAAKKSAITPATDKTPAPAPVTKAAAKKVPTKKTPAVKAAATTAAARKATATKAIAAKPPVGAESSKARASREEIEHAAYLNYCGRKEKALSGDPHTDWIEAERRLL